MARTYEELVDLVMEAVDTNDSIMEEGTNTRLRGIKGNAKTLKKINIKGMKQMYKNGDYAGAKKAGEEILAAIDECEKEFKSVDQSFGSAALGDLMGFGLRLVKDLALGLITFGIGPVIVVCKRLLSACIQRGKMAGKRNLDYKMFNRYALDILTMLDDMKHQVKAVMAKCDEGMSTTNPAQESVDAAYAEYLQNEYDELITEGVLSNPIKKYLEHIKEIKKKKPSEYDGPEEVKKFVDANYDDIVKTTEILENEPDELRKNQLISAASTVIGLLGMYAGMGIGLASITTGALFFGLSFALFLAGALVSPLITYARASSDRKAMDELSKVRDALTKVRNKTGNKLPTPLRNKITDLVTKIDDAETEMNARLKSVGANESTDESLDNRLAIYESAYAGDISEEDRDELLTMIDTAENLQ